MQTSKILVIVILFLSLVGCKNNNAKSGTQRTEEGYGVILDSMKIPNIQPNIAMIDSNFVQTLEDKDLILRRLKVQYSWDDMDPFDKESYNTTNEDVEAGASVVYYIMQKKGFRPVSDSVFYEKTREFFGIDLAHESFYVVKHPDFFTRLVPSHIDIIDEVMTGTETHPESTHYYFFKKEKIFLIGVPFVSGLLDENGALFNYDGINADNYDNYRNDFIFHDDGNSLVWLINNDIWFLERLVREFGYCKNEEVNRAVLAKIHNDFIAQKDDLSSLFALKDRDQRLRIREDLIKYIANTTKGSNRDMFDMMESYAQVLIASLDISEDNNSVTKYFNRDEKIKIIAHISYYAQPVYQRNGWTGGVMHNFVSQNRDILDYLEYVNYYNLRGYSELLETAK
jgi:hypothetical protein